MNINFDNILFNKGNSQIVIATKLDAKNTTFLWLHSILHVHKYMYTYMYGYVYKVCNIKKIVQNVI